MRRSQSTGRICKFESLENRWMMAGDVTAQIINGNLLIRGDTSDNIIAITSPATGSITITGTNTTVNTLSTPVTLTGFTGGIKMKMEEGNDSVTLTSLTVDGKVKFKGEEGDDTFQTSGTNTFNDKLVVKMGEGDDTVTLPAGVTVTGKTKIKGGDGTDNITITCGNFSTLKVKLGDDDDTLSITSTTVTEHTRLNGGDGTNTFTNGAGNSLADLEQKNFSGV
jgi:hypothetical protein